MVPVTARRLRLHLPHGRTRSLDNLPMRFRRLGDKLMAFRFGALSCGADSKPATLLLLSPVRRQVHARGSCFVFGHHLPLLTGGTLFGYGYLGDYRVLEPGMDGNVRVVTICRTTCCRVMNWMVVTLGYRSGCGRCGSHDITVWTARHRSGEPAEPCHVQAAPSLKLKSLASISSTAWPAWTTTVLSTYRYGVFIAMIARLGSRA